jgi:hypothetical protein
MSRRQPLGALTVNQQTNSVNANLNINNNKNNNIPKVGFYKANSFASSTAASLKSTTNLATRTNSFNSKTINLNDENGPPKKILSKQPQHPIQSQNSENEFEIFSDLCLSSRQNSVQPKREKNVLKEINISRDKSVENADEICDQSDCIFDQEEEENGIRKLDFAPTTSKHTPATCQTNFEEIMESPMFCDVSLKHISKIESESDTETHHDNENDLDSEEDEEARKRFESENILFNMIDYKEDIMRYMRKSEIEMRPKANYIKKQMDITTTMRAILVDWLVEVCEEYKLNSETLNLAVMYTDRFLSQMSVLRSKLQLVGTASMYIAAKYEEITPPDVNEFVYITDDTYTKKQVLRMEHLLLKVMDFRVSQPTTNWFLTNYLKFIKLNTNLSTSNNSDLFQRIEYLARYLSELTLLDADQFLCYLPSQIAASAIYIALHTFNKQFTRQIAHILGYDYDLSELKACIYDMFNFFHQAAKYPQQAIQEKYKQAKYDHVALVEIPKTLPAVFYTNVCQTTV